MKALFFSIALAAGLALWGAAPGFDRSFDGSQQDCGRAGLRSPALMGIKAQS